MLKNCHLRRWSPYFALLYGVHRRAYGTAPIRTKFLHVGEWSVDPEHCWCVWISQHLVLESSFPPNAAPVPGVRDPEKLSGGVTQAWESRLLTPPFHNLLVRPDCLLYSTKSR